MILVDTSIWIDHLRSGDVQLAALLENSNVLGHSWALIPQERFRSTSKFRQWVEMDRDRLIER